MKRQPQRPRPTMKWSRAGSTYDRRWSSYCANVAQGHKARVSLIYNHCATDARLLQSKQERRVARTGRNECMSDACFQACIDQATCPSHVHSCEAHLRLREVCNCSTTAFSFTSVSSHSSSATDASTIPAPAKAQARSCRKRCRANRNHVNTISTQV